MKNIKILEDNIFWHYNDYVGGLYYVLIWELKISRIQLSRNFGHKYFIKFSDIYEA